MIIMFLINQKETLEEQLLSDEKWWKTIKIDEKYNEEDVSDKPVGDTLGTIAQHIIYFGTLAEKYFFQMNLNIVFDYIFVIFWLYLNYILMTFLFWLYFDKKKTLLYFGTLDAKYNMNWRRNDWWALFFINLISAKVAPDGINYLAVVPCLLVKPRNCLWMFFYICFEFPKFP